MLSLMNFHSIQTIEKAHHTLEGCFTALLEEWLKSSPNPTWSDLLKPLRSSVINRHDIASKIEIMCIKSDNSSVQESRDTAGE